MPISKGESWGAPVAAPTSLSVAADDADLARRVVAGSGPLAVSGGDLFVTLGGRDVGGRSELNALPIDAVDVSLDGEAPLLAVAHVLLRRPWSRGGWWRGAVMAIMNAEFVGSADVAPRGHPNDGRVEVLACAPEMSIRQRLAVRRRLRSATHLPHPQITTRSVRTATWTFDEKMIVVIDGVVVGTARTVSIAVREDAFTLYA